MIIEPDSPVPLLPETVMSFFTMTFLGKDVETVIVNGRVVVKGKELKTGDEKEIMDECVKESSALWARNK